MFTRILAKTGILTQLCVFERLSTRSKKFSQSLQAGVRHAYQAETVLTHVFTRMNSAPLLRLMFMNSLNDNLSLHHAQND